MRSAEQPVLAVKLSIVHTKDWLPVVSLHLRGSCIT